MIYDSLHDYIYTGIGICIGIIIGMFYQFIKTKRGNENG